MFSAGLGGGSVTLDGTSMATWHIAGVAALYEQRNPGATPEGIAFRLDDQPTEVRPVLPEPGFAEPASAHRRTLIPVGRQRTTSGARSRRAPLSAVAPPAIRARHMHRTVKHLRKLRGILLSPACGG
ncbi:S8 family serine peptidase [Streptomyces sp. NBC_01224]|uniref:S8 family serine peptidase n=1 Tax=Streptomyces sp. NBC_01224 TaxID=2903783 RepID=UPI003FA3AAD6